MDVLLDNVRRRDRRSLAKAMSLVEQATEETRVLKDALRRCTGQVPWWGFTGPPGVGKSTLIDALLQRLRGRGCRVGVVAVDPTSPISEGALLGDRIRMMRHAVDENVFIRSLATHGREGGLSDATIHCARLLELAGYDPVLIETVGVGQNEVDLASLADVCVVMLAPGFGDDIQLTKAGLLEIADLIVVNKCDILGADRLLKDVREALGGSSSVYLVGEEVDASGNDPSEPNGTIELIGVEANSGKGLEQLADKLFELDGIARSREARQSRAHSRVLDELRHNSVLAYREALDKELASPASQRLVERFLEGACSMDDAIVEISNRAASTAGHSGRSTVS